MRLLITEYAGTRLPPAVICFTVSKVRKMSTTNEPAVTQMAVFRQKDSDAHHNACVCDMVMSSCYRC